MYRDIMRRLEDWKKDEYRKPLIIKGARQVGKTYSIRKFAIEHYQHMVEINFEKDLEFHELFSVTRQPKEILAYLQLTYLDVPFDEHTLLFLDEIQACSSALTALKFLAQEFSCDIICSGSMLGVAIASTSSFPVGYVETWDMYPMTFLEFLKAYGVKQEMLELLKQHVMNLEPLPEMIHQKMYRLFNTYLVVGGMPEVVKTYIHTQSYRDSLMVQRRIVSDYLNDMAKYADGTTRIKARECFESIPLQLAKKNKKFQYKLVKNGGSARHYEASLKWLSDRGLVIPVHRLKAIEMPLEIHKELPVFKIYFADTGLFVSQLNEAVIKALIQGDLGVYKGAVYENMVSQILHRYHKASYYFEPNTSSEIDFIIYYEGEITPLEIKAGKNTRSISFQNFVEKYQPYQAYRFSAKNISKGGQITYLPLYTLEILLQIEKQLF